MEDWDYTPCGYYLDFGTSTTGYVTDNQGCSTYITPPRDLSNVYLWPNGSTSEFPEGTAVSLMIALKQHFLSKILDHFQSLKLVQTRNYKWMIETIHHVGIILISTHQLLDVWLTI